MRERNAQYFLGSILSLAPGQLPSQERVLACCRKENGKGLFGNHSSPFISFTKASASPKRETRIGFAQHLQLLGILKQQHVFFLWELAPCLHVFLLWITPPYLSMQNGIIWRVIMGASTPKCCRTLKNAWPWFMYFFWCLRLKLFCPGPDYSGTSA